MNMILDKSEQRIEDNAYAYIPVSHKENEYIETLLNSSKRDVSYAVPQIQFMEARDSATVSCKTEPSLKTLTVTVLNQNAIGLLKALENEGLIQISH